MSFWISPRQQLYEVTVSWFWPSSSEESRDHDRVQISGSNHQDSKVVREFKCMIDQANRKKILGNSKHKQSETWKLSMAHSSCTAEDSLSRAPSIARHGAYLSKTEAIEATAVRRAIRDKTGPSSLKRYSHSRTLVHCRALVAIRSLSLYSSTLSLDWRRMQTVSWFLR